MVEFNPDGSIKLTDSQEAAHAKKREIEARKEKSERQLNNTFFRDTIYRMFDNKCVECNTTRNLQIHHERYNWYCPYLEKNKDPDCKTCHDTDWKTHLNCISCVRLLCQSCHTERHKILKNITGHWTGYARAAEKPGKDECRFCNSKIDDEMLYCPKCDRKLKMTKKEERELDERFDQALKAHKEFKNEAYLRISKQFGEDQVENGKLFREALKEIDKNLLRLVNEL